MPADLLLDAAIAFLKRYKVEPNRGIEPRSLSYKISASPQCLNGKDV